jgi:hypothetical protein
MEGIPYENSLMLHSVLKNIIGVLFFFRSTGVSPQLHFLIEKEAKFCRVAHTQTNKEQAFLCWGDWLPSQPISEIPANLGTKTKE